MSSQLQFEVLFEVNDVFGRRIRTTKSYWDHIIGFKHKEAKDVLKLEHVTSCIHDPEVVYTSDEETVLYFYRTLNQQLSVCVVVKHLNGEGFLVTCYLTSKRKRKGEKIWPKI